MMEDNIIDISVDPVDPSHTAMNAHDFVQMLSCSVRLRIGEASFSLRGEPALNFIREYHTALVNSVLFDIPSVCSMFSDDIAIGLTKVAHDSDAMLVEARVSDKALGSLTAPKKALTDVFKDGVSQIVAALRPRFSFAEIADALSSPMIPLNEGYAPTFFGDIGSEGSKSMIAR
jgi:hypothetical protein